MIMLWLYLKMSLIAGSYTKVFGSDVVSDAQLGPQMVEAKTICSILEAFCNFEQVSKTEKKQ